MEGTSALKIRSLTVSPEYSKLEESFSVKMMLDTPKEKNQSTISQL